MRKSQGTRLPAPFLRRLWLREDRQPRLLEISRAGIAETTFQQTRHFRLYQAFIGDPDRFIADALTGDDDLP